MIPPLSTRIENERKWNEHQKQKLKEDLEKHYKEAEEEIEEMEREAERRKREGASYLDAWKKAAKAYEAAEQRAAATEKALEDCWKRPAEGRPGGAGFDRDRCEKEEDEHRDAMKALGEAWNALSDASDEYLRRFPPP